MAGSIRACAAGEARVAASRAHPGKVARFGVAIFSRLIPSRNSFPSMPLRVVLVRLSGRQMKHDSEVVSYTVSLWLRHKSETLLPTPATLLSCLNTLLLWCFLTYCPPAFCLACP